MTFPRSLVILVLSGLTLEAANVPKKQGFDGYPMVGGRNIFNPDRMADVATSAPVQAAPAAAPVSGSDAAALTGTMLTGRKALAFFSGSRPEWGGVFGIGASIAGARIKKITAGGIEVEREGKSIAVAVGQCVPLDANSAPSVAPVFAPQPSSYSAPAPVQGSSVPTANSTAPAPADREALIRRMMEKRQQELK